MKKIRIDYLPKIGNFTSGLIMFIVEIIIAIIVLFVVLLFLVLIVYLVRAVIFKQTDLSVIWNWIMLHKFKIVVVFLLTYIFDLRYLLQKTNDKLSRIERLLTDYTIMRRNKK